MTDRIVLLRRPQVHGNVTRMVRATVMSENNGTLRVIPEGQRNPIVVKASETLDATTTFGTRLAMQKGVVIQRALPDNPNSLSRIVESK
jgi:hypothetical protein